MLPCGEGSHPSTFSRCWWRAFCASWPRVLRPCTSMGPSAAISTRHCSANDKKNRLFFGGFGVLRLVRLARRYLSGKPFDDRRGHHRCPGKLADGGLEPPGEALRGVRAIDRLAAALDLLEERPRSEDGAGRGGDEALAHRPHRRRAELADDLRRKAAGIRAQLGLDLVNLP